MRFLTLGELLDLHSRILIQSGGAEGIRDLGLAESALAQPLMSFSGADLYPTLAEKAAALCFSLVLNHPFNDGNKHIEHAAMETFLILNGSELNASVNDAESIIIQLAAGELSREKLTVWVVDNLTSLQ